MAILGRLFGLLVLMAAAPAARADEAPPPHVLFIALDDQNDWVGPLGGHAFVQTPQLDRLAARGTTFLSAHVQSPLCNPSRTSLLLGLRPTTTGVYGLAPWFRDVPALQDRVTLPQQLRRHGYRTLTCGKVFHGGPRPPDAAREFDVWGPAGGVGARPPQKLIGRTPMGDHPLMDWGAFPHRDEDKGDYAVASWAVDQLRRAPHDEPFFLAVGFFLPHVPCYVPPERLERFPDDDRILPPILEGDRDDTPRFSWYLHWDLPEPRTRWLRETGQLRPLVRAYLASTSFVDAQIGRLLDALDETGLAENTIVVVWSDNGWHLGEKGVTGKNTLWERSTRVPLLLAGPGVKAGQRCTQPVELLDLYPTLLDLCGLPARDDLEGLSLRPQLANASAPRERPALTSHNPGNHAVRSSRFRYIRYADGSEELYDHDADPREEINLASRPAAAPDESARLSEVLAEHRQWLPQTEAPFAPGSADRILSYDRETDTAQWENRISIHRGDAIP